jgi:hypothetical protein
MQRIKNEARRASGITAHLRQIGRLDFAAGFAEKYLLKISFYGEYRGGMACKRIYVFGHPLSKLDAAGAGDRGFWRAVAVAIERSRQLS